MGIDGKILKMKMMSHFWLISAIWLVCAGIMSSDNAPASESELRLKIYTVATDRRHEGFERYARSARIFGYDLRVLDAGSAGWQGGDVKHTTGGGQKVNLLRQALLDRYSGSEADKNEFVLFTDSYDVILADGPDELLKRFAGAEHRILFSAEPHCWPDKSLAAQYPKLPSHLAGHGARFLNSGGLIAYAKDLSRLLEQHAVDLKDQDDDQLFYTKLFLDESIRKKFSLGLDYGSKIFQNLNGAQDQVQLRFTEAGTPAVINTATQSSPMVIHGNGGTKGLLANFGNYLANSWSSSTNGCGGLCSETRIDLLKLRDLPRILIGIFILKPTPFLAEFLETLDKLEYPKSKISLFIQSPIDYHSNLVNKFISDHKLDYETIELKPAETVEWKARNSMMEECFKLDCDYYLSLDAEARLDNVRTLVELVAANRTIVAPLLSRPGKLWSTFWGALTPEGYYARSGDYVELVKGRRRGLWQVPHISYVYLIKGDLIKTAIQESQNAKENQNPIKLSFYDDEHPAQDADMTFTAHIRQLDGRVAMWLLNSQDFGHLVSTDNFNISHFKPEMYEIQENPLDWEQKYLHPSYARLLSHVPKEGDSLNGMVDMVPGLLEQPCHDVYWFPLVSDTFTRDLIAMMEHFGQWSDGTNRDARLQGGYENVPTRDIHMKQVSYEEHWLHFLRVYVKPVQEKVFIGYFHDPPKAVMNFVVRYHPAEQPLLRPHHDSSTYTLNIALNSGGGVDYEGGGCRFLRYNCSVVDTRPGWALIHPGRLTHFHEGLPVTSGTRYIMISFIDP